MKTTIALLSMAVLTVSAAGFSPAEAADRSQKRVAVVRTLYGLLPQARSVLAGQVSADNLFASTVQGRLTPLGQGSDPATVKNYFFGAVTFLPSSSATVSAVDFKSLVVRNDQVWVDANITLDDPNTTPSQLKLHQIGFFRFNHANQISSFDLTMPYLDAAAASVGVDLSSPAVLQHLAQSICTSQANICSGATQQYADFPSCFAFIMSIRAGTFDRTSSNSVACRTFQAGLAAANANPALVCPAIGPTGGGTCVDTPYSDYFVPRY